MVSGLRPDARPADLRIIVLFGNTPLLGNERANIETMRQLRDRGAETLFLVRREWAGEIHAELRRLSLPYRFCPYYDTVRHGVGPWIWLKNVWGILAGSALLLWLWYRWRPTHIHLGSTAWALNFWPALLVMGTPLVFRAGDVPTQHHRVWTLVWRYLTRRASVFVCDSLFIEQQLLTIGTQAESCRVVYAPAPERADVDVSDINIERTDDRLTLVYVGQITAEKGVDRLIEAVRSLAAQQPVRLIVAGDFTWKNPFARQLVERVQADGLSDYIIFTGFVKDIRRLYAIADLHVAPSVWPEPYGLTVLEAKTHGLPSVVFASGGLTELVEHGIDGWVCDRPDADCLVQALRFYLENPAALAIQGAAAKASLTERLRVQDFGARWRAVYDEVARRGRNVVA